MKTLWVSLSKISFWNQTPPLWDGKHMSCSTASTSMLITCLNVWIKNCKKKMLIYLYSGTSTNNNKQQHCSAVSIANLSGLSKIIEKTSDKMCRQNQDRFGGSLRIRHLRFILASWNKTRRRTRAWGLIENKLRPWWGGGGGRLGGVCFLLFPA